MTKKEACFKIFTDNPNANRDRVIELVIKIVGVTQTTAQTYYPAWRKELMNKTGYVESPKKGMQENIKNITKNTEIITEKANKITEVAEKSPIKVIDIPESKPTFNEMKEAIKDVKVEGFNWKTDAIKPIETIKEKEDIFVTNLIPVIMKGKYGSYEFGNDGVKAIPYGDEFINKEKMDESIEALKIWERCYEKEDMPKC